MPLHLTSGQRGSEPERYNSNKKMSTINKHVVIVGSGYAGACAATKLDSFGFEGKFAKGRLMFKILKF
jgi:hypothetical protein